MWLVVAVVGYDRPEVLMFRFQSAAVAYFDECAKGISVANYGWAQIYQVQGVKLTLLDEA